MRTLSLAGTGFFLVVTLILGVRLLARGRRTRGAPEIGLGVFLLLGVALGYALGSFVYFHRVVPASVQTWLAPLVNLNMSLGTAALLLFTWRVFRPETRWALVTCFAGIAGLVLGGIAMGRTTGFAVGHGWSPAYTTLVVVRGAAFAWAATEALRYYVKARARVRLGLTEPSVAVRFLLWGLGCLLTLLPFVVHVATRFTSPELTHGPGQALLVSFVGVVSTTSFWIAFFPPVALRQRLERAVS